MKRTRAPRLLSTLPLADLALAAVLVAASGYIWFHSAGQRRLARAAAGLEETRAAEAEKLARTQESLDLARGGLEDARATQDRQRGRIEELQGQLAAEEEHLRRSQEEDGRLTDRLLEVRQELQQALVLQEAQAAELQATETALAGARDTIADLDARLSAVAEEQARLDAAVAAARARAQADPPSRFPDRGGLALAAELADPGERLVLSLTRGLTRVGAVDVGLLGSLGLGTPRGSSLREGGVFANLSLARRRASLDLEGGLSQLLASRDEAGGTSPFAGATLRVAPARGERIFVLAGTRYRGDDLGLRLGLGLGRR
jgi:hypothetical protein